VLFNQPFESGLLTEYNGSASLGQHRDDEETIVKKSKVVCVSVGKNRAIKISQKGERPVQYMIKAGALYSMEGDFQEFLKHGVPQAPNSPGIRYSITFRHLHKAAVEDTRKRKSLSKKAAQGQSKKHSNAGRGGPSGSRK
jgi:hypothetical protein